MSNRAFNAGERAVQEHFGSRALLRDHEREIFGDLPLTGKAAQYVAALPLVALATQDPDGFPFVSLEAGPVRVTGAERVVVPAVRDPERLRRHLERHGALGAVLVDLARRLRFRINGRGGIAGRDLVIEIEHAFGNCRKYLHQVEHGPSPAAAPSFQGWRDRLDAADGELLDATTHVFIATQDAGGDLDAQYKGGLPGWLVVEDDRTLVYPDYPGNGFYMSLGNLQEDPRLGMLAPNGLILQGEASLAGDATARFPGAQSVVRFRLTRVARVRDAVPWRTRFVAPSSTFAHLAGAPR